MRPDISGAAASSRRARSMDLFGPQNTSRALKCLGLRSRRVEYASSGRGCVGARAMFATAPPAWRGLFEK